MLFTTTDNKGWRGMRWCGCERHTKPCALNAFPNRIAKNFADADSMHLGFSTVDVEPMSNGRLLANDSKDFCEFIEPGEWIFESNDGEYLRLKDEVVRGMLRQPSSPAKCETREVSFAELGVERPRSAYADFKAVYTPDAFVGVVDDCGVAMPHSLAEYFIENFLDDLAEVPEWSEQMQEAI